MCVCVCAKKRIIFESLLLCATKASCNRVLSHLIGSLCENDSKDDPYDGSGPQDRTEDETPAPSPSDTQPASLLASSPSNCQDPFCSHPFPPSPSPLPARPKAKRAKKMPKIPKIEVKIEDLYHEEEEEVSLTSGKQSSASSFSQIGWVHSVSCMLVD